MSLVLNAEPVPPSRLQPKIERDLETICLKCLEKDYRNRYATALELAERLRLFLDGKPIPDRPSGLMQRTVKWARRRPAHALLAAVSCSAALLFLFVWGKFTFELNDKQLEILAERDRVSAGRVDVMVGFGARLMDEGDNLNAFSWFVNALVAERGGLEKDQMHRRRIGEVVARMPRLQDFRVFNQTVPCVAFSPNGDRLLICTGDGNVSIENWATGKESFAPLQHDAAVFHAEFSPDGSLVATWDSQGKLYLWDAARGVSIPLLLATEENVFYMTFSMDGNFLLIVMPQEVLVWDKRTSKLAETRLRHPVLSASGPPLNFSRAAISDDSQMIVTASKDCYARIWDWPSGRESAPPLLHPNEVWAVAISPDKQLIATGCQDRVARIWESHTGKLLFQFPQKGAVNQVRFVDDGRSLITSALDGTIGVWKTTTGGPLYSFDQKSEPGTIHISPDGRQLSSISNNGVVRIWNLETGQLVGTSIQHRGKVSSMAFHPDGRRIVTSGEDGTVRVWDFAARDLPLTLRHANQLTEIRFSHDSCRLATGSWDFTARVWNAANGQALGEPLQHPNAAFRLALSPDGEQLVTTCLDGKVRVWNLTQPISELNPLQIDIGVTAQGVAIHPGGRYFVTTGANATAVIREMHSGRAVHTLQHAGTVEFVVYSPDGTLVVTTSLDKSARLWNAESGMPAVPQPLAHKGEVLHAAFSPKGDRLVTASADNTSRIWNVATGTEVTQEPLRHPARVYFVAFSPDGKRVATACDDGSATIWNATTGRPVLAPIRHNGSVNRVQFSRDGRLLLTGSTDRTARVWDAATGQPITAPLIHSDQVVDACFSPDGERVATAGNDSSARISRLHFDDRPLTALKLSSELLTGRRMLADGSSEELTVQELADNWRKLQSP